MEYDNRSIEKETTLSDCDPNGPPTIESMLPPSIEQVHEWKNILDTSMNIVVIRKVIQAFTSALNENGAVTHKKQSSSSIVYRDPNVLNVLTQTCLGRVVQCLLTIHVHSKSWNKNKGYIRAFLSNLIELGSNVLDSSDICSMVLRTDLKALPLYAEFPLIERKLIKHLVQVWSSSSRSTINGRISFICLHKIASSGRSKAEDIKAPEDPLHCVLKFMINDYLANTRRVTEETCDVIGFMQNSIADICAINPDLAYPICFVHMRNLAIKLRQAIRNPKEKLKEVTCWPFMKGLELWTTVICLNNNPADSIELLVAPLVQLITETMRICGQSPRYQPLRFFCIAKLISLCKEKKTFIPVLRQIEDALRLIDLNRNTKTANRNNENEPNFVFSLKLNKEQMQTNSFQDSVVDTLYGLSLEYAAHYACHISFPDLVYAFVRHILALSKTCERDHHRIKFKSLYERLADNSKYIEETRNSNFLDLREQSQTEHWIRQREMDGKCPLFQFYDQYKGSKRRMRGNTEIQSSTKVIRRDARKK
ncbi:hypothetical protein ACOME3_008760 [Neoechinorhynchus agilis]